MPKYQKKPTIVEAITFDEFVLHGMNTAKSIVNGMPWSFDYKGYPITHENDQCYLIPCNTGGVEKFTPNDMLITGVDGEIYPCPLSIFEKTYIRVD